jgi:hypothetical protein
LAAATLAALLSYYLQGRNWTYHFVPPVGLGILLALWLARAHASGKVLAALLIAVQLVRGPHEGRPSAPMEDPSVAVLSAHVHAAYPAAFDQGVHNATRYPALWVLPGAWNILNDPSRPIAERRRALSILKREREVIRGDILLERPSVIYAHANSKKRYYRARFDYLEFLGPLPGYRYVGKTRSGRYVYDVLRRS